MNFCKFYKSALSSVGRQGTSVKSMSVSVAYNNTSQQKVKSVRLEVSAELSFFTRGLLEAIYCACVCLSPPILSCICERTEIHNCARDSKFSTQIYKLQNLFKAAGVPIYRCYMKGCRTALINIYICT